MSPATRAAATATALLLAAAVNVAAQEPPAPRARSSLRIGLRKQLLVDDLSIERMANVTRVLGSVTKANGGKPLLVADRPWEGVGFCWYATVLRDGPKFRMWYLAFENTVAYAESEDGLRWEKPNLGVFQSSLETARRYRFRPRPGQEPDFGDGKNNLIGFFGDGFTCFLDPHETDPEHRYKCCYGHPSKIRACIGHSPDGIHWTPYNQGEPVTGRAADTYNQVLWDDAARTYRMYTRTDFGSVDGIEIRGNRGMTNPDLKQNPTGWKTVRSWKLEREGPREGLRRQVYALTDWIYEGVHFALVRVIEFADDHSEGAYDLVRRHERDVCNSYIATSRDGDGWDLRWIYASQPIVPRGPDGSFDKDMTTPTSQVITHQDKHWIYYIGGPERHTIEKGWEAAIGLAWLRLDGFVGLEARGLGGTVETKTFSLEGRALEVNVDAGRGELVVEILDESRRPIPGYTRADAEVNRAVDQLRLRPRWRGHVDLGPLKGRNVALRFYLNDARIYAFQVRDDEPGRPS